MKYQGARPNLWRAVRPALSRIVRDKAARARARDDTSPAMSRYDSARVFFFFFYTRRLHLRRRLALLTDIKDIHFCSSPAYLQIFSRSGIHRTPATRAFVRFRRKAKSYADALG